MFDASQFMPVDIQLPAPPRRALPDQAGARHGVRKRGADRRAGHDFAGERTRSACRRRRRSKAWSTGPGGSIDTIIGTGTPPPPPPAAAAPTAPYSAALGHECAGEKTADVAPIYSSIAQTARIEGVVILEAVIDATGGVESVRVLRSIPLLDQAAARRGSPVRRFTPARLNEEAVPVVMTVTVELHAARTVMMRWGRYALVLAALVVALLLAFSVRIERARPAPGAAAGDDDVLDRSLARYEGLPRIRASVARSMLPPLITQTTFLPAS